MAKQQWRASIVFWQMRGVGDFLLNLPFLKGANMLNITIDDKEYDITTFSEEAKAQLSSLQFVDAELQRLQSQAAAMQTARIAYANALKAVLPEAK
jgi:hypothetical protein